MRYFIGIDIHRKFIAVCVVDQDGNVVRQANIDLDRVDEIVEFFSQFAGGTELVMEATMGWMWLTDLMEGMGLEVSLAHMNGVRVIAESRCKTDKVDAQTLAQLLRTNYLPKAYLAPPDVRDKRMTLGHRQRLVKWRTCAKNCVHAILVRYNVHPGMSDIFGVKGMQMLKALELPGRARRILDGLLQTIEFYNGQLDKVEEDLRKWLKPDPRVGLLTSMPGVGDLTAYFVIAEIGTIERFRSASRFVSYCGLCPSNRRSAQHVVYGTIRGGGRTLLQWSLIEAAHTAVRHDSYLAKAFHRIAKRKGDGKAYVVVARRMAQIIWRMLSENRPYEAKVKQTRVGSSWAMTDRVAL
jgi:transposase